MRPPRGIATPKLLGVALGLTVAALLTAGVVVLHRRGAVPDWAVAVLLGLVLVAGPAAAASGKSERRF